jgi:hypothetical protein
MQHSLGRRSGNAITVISLLRINSRISSCCSFRTFPRVFRQRLFDFRPQRHTHLLIRFDRTLPMSLACLSAPDSVGVAGSCIRSPRYAVTPVRSRTASAIVGFFSTRRAWCKGAIASGTNPKNSCCACAIKSCTPGNFTIRATVPRSTFSFFAISLRFSPAT